MTERTYRDDNIEAASGKGAGDENFPVGSFLIAPSLRPDVKAYYDFARAADDIGDAPHLSAADKVRRLDAFGAVLRGEAAGLSKPEALREHLLRRGIPLDRGLDLLEAFKRDAVCPRTETAAELLDYCRLSANPVGQFLLDLHGEDRALFPSSDSLCTSLQILNHLQDAQEDLRELDRCYLPEAMMREEGASVADLEAPTLTPAMRRVMDRLLDLCRDLNRQAEDLLMGLKSRRLAAESAVILRLAKRLTAKLGEGDPVAGRVALGKADFLIAGSAGIIEGARPRRAA